jgi:hypothetical protein
MSESTVIFIEGVAAVAAAIIVFCGSVWLVLMLVLGARLAYFVTATVTLGILLIMGVVWSINQLGPVGELPSWHSIGAGDTSSEIEFPAADTYPDEPWAPVDEDDKVQTDQAALLKNAADNVLVDAVDKGKVTTFTTANVTKALATDDTARLLEQGGNIYGAVTFEDVKKTRAAVVIMKYDPGNPLGPPRQITAGLLVLFVLHLFGLSRVEKRAKTVTQEA